MVPISVVTQLEKDGITAMAIHGRKKSERALRHCDFKDGKLPVLVATDIAARNVDIDNFHVVGY